jgi:hypothetical protein
MDMHTLNSSQQHLADIRADMARRGIKPVTDWEATWLPLFRGFKQYSIVIAALVGLAAFLFLTGCSDREPNGEKVKEPTYTISDYQGRYWTGATEVREGLDGDWIRFRNNQGKLVIVTGWHTESEE